MRKQTKLWTTKDGRKIRICDMEDSHLDNTIHLLERFAKHKEHYYMIIGFQVLNFLQGEEAIDSVEREFDRLATYGVDPSEITSLYENLVLEKERRSMMTDDRSKKKWEFYVAGVQHHQLSSVIEMIAEGDDLTLQPEPENKYDPNAMKVLYNPGEVMLGYVPKRVSAEVTYAYRANNNELGCVAIRVSPESQPWTQLMVKVWIV